MIPSTNLALRPFRNERLPWLLAGGLAVLAGLISLLHVRLVSRLLSGDEAKTVRQVRENESRISELEAAIALEPPLRLGVEERSRLQAIKDLVDRRVFPWRRFLSDLENVLPDDVRLIRIAPSRAKGARAMLIDLAGEARSKDAAFSLAEDLDLSPVFSNPVLRSLSESDGQVEFELQVTFDPEVRPELPPGAPASPSPKTVALNPFQSGRER